MNSFFGSSLFLYGAIPVLIIFIYAIYKFKKESKNLQFLILIVLVGLVGVFIHGEAPIHYYLPLLVPLIIIVSSVLSEFKNKFLYLALILISLVNISYFFSTKWFYIDQSSFSPDIPVPYNLQLKASKAIVEDVGGYPYSLARTGPFDSFSKNYAQNYIYLLTLMGNTPTDGQILKYHIYEGVEPKSTEKIIFNEGKIIVTR